MASRDILVSNPIPYGELSRDIIPKQDMLLIDETYEAVLYLGTLDELVYEHLYLLESAAGWLKKPKSRWPFDPIKSNIAYDVYNEWPEHKIRRLIQVSEGFFEVPTDLERVHEIEASVPEPIGEYLSEIRRTQGYLLDYALEFFSGERLEKISMCIGYLSCFFPWIIPSNASGECTTVLPYIYVPLRVASESARGSYHPEISDRIGEYPTFSSDILQQQTKGRSPSRVIVHEMIELAQNGLNEKKHYGEAEHRIRLYELLVTRIFEPELTVNDLIENLKDYFPYERYRNEMAEIYSAAILAGDPSRHQPPWERLFSNS